LTAGTPSAAISRAVVGLALLVTGAHERDRPAQAALAQHRARRRAWRAAEPSTITSAGISARGP
jgi:hypothetical protein